MIVNLNPYAYAKMYAWDKPECDFDLNHNGMNPDRTEFVGGRGKDIPHSGDSKCGSIVPVTETIGDTQYTVYKRDFVIQHNEDFTSSLDEIVTAMCYFDASGISVTSDISTVSLAKANLGSTSIKEEFSPVTLSLQVDDAIPGNSVNVGQKLSFTLTVGSEFSELFLKEVKLDNGKPEADDMYQSFKILENGCKSTTKGKDVWIAHPTHPDGDNQVVLFEVKAFVFTKATVLKAIFTTKVCATSDSSCDAVCICVSLFMCICRVKPVETVHPPDQIDCSGQQSSGRRKRSTDDGTNNTYVIDETVRVIYPGRKGVSVTKTGERRQEEGCETSSAMIGTVAALAGVVFLLVVLLLALVVRSFRRNNRNSRADKMDGVISPYFTKDSQ
ncbi:uncharacterized protein LOC121373118 [Gigantopelta aegis]|uniref:uncharacterized protein LOC121373118 n=1 Tax=Gigantopelta aegis TaxID=1735272 RepID=UPI001B88E243|nr:uncharacterized protein LOC121373118 [Gigantopelta aegis]